MAQSVDIPAPGRIAPPAAAGRGATQAGAGPATQAIPTAAVPVRRSPVGRTAIHVVLALGALYSFFPFYWMVVTSFKSNNEAIASPPTWIPRQWHPENYVLAFNAAPFARYFFNTMV